MHNSSTEFESYFTDDHNDQGPLRGSWNLEKEIHKSVEGHIPTSSAVEACCMV